MNSLSYWYAQSNTEPELFWNKDDGWGSYENKTNFSSYYEMEQSCPYSCEWRLVSDELYNLLMEEDDEF